MRIIPRTFYQRDTVKVAKDLIGKILVRRFDGQIISGVITETEAYRYKDDPASHSFGGITERNKPMFGEVGRAYVYFTYGMHYCVNAVAREKTLAAGAVLIRSLIPMKGLDFMMRQRKLDLITNLTNGPAKLTQALNITKRQNGEDLTKVSSLYIIEGKEIKDFGIEVSPRIGIKKGIEKKWNFKLKAELR